MVIAADAIEQGSEDFQDTVPELIFSSSRRIAKANIDLLHSARFLSKLVDFQLRARTWIHLMNWGIFFLATSS
jgi:hypothetical protein